MPEYVCVNCGASIAELYRKYNNDVLKLNKCASCKLTADKYIEYDVVIILIDLILFKKEPYRHVLFNTAFKNHLKLWVLTFLLKTYVTWSARTDRKDAINVVAEHAFYMSAIITAAGAVTFLGTILLAIKADARIKGRDLSRAQTLQIWKALVLSDFGQFLLLPSLVWIDVPKTTHSAVVVVYVIVSQMQALSVVTSASRLVRLLSLLMGIFLEWNVTEVIRKILYRLGT